MKRFINTWGKRSRSRGCRSEVLTQFNESGLIGGNHPPIVFFVEFELRPFVPYGGDLDYDGAGVGIGRTSWSFEAKSRIRSSTHALRE